MDQWSEAAFTTEEAAYRFVEARVWPEGPVCPHCGRGDRIGRLAGKDSKPGSYKCYACRKPFNVKLGTMLESMHVPLHLWLQALFLLHACDPPVSVNRLHRILGVSSRTSWLMSQRFRERLLAEGTDDGEPERADGAERNAAADRSREAGRSRRDAACGWGSAADFGFAVGGGSA
ncbi:transposase [Salinarimonas rosea]|uniref:transposase n=1 Tax=Salinarimonas rosea TaxID=552063 RepID=UPI000694B183|nr:transposase [Salinarimonas rosea]